MDQKKTNEQNSQKAKRTICMCIDIRRSTTFHEKCKSIKKAGEIIDNFISKIYVSLKNVNPALTAKFVYAGDGIMFIHEINGNKIEIDKNETNTNNHQNNDGLIQQFVDSIPGIEDIIKEFENKYKIYEFSAGIGLDIGDCMEVRVKEIPNVKGKTNLYVGSPVSKANKLCKLMPFTWNNEKKYTAISYELFNELNDREIKHSYKLTRSEKRAM
jgi:hypothetical protein